IACFIWAKVVQNLLDHYARGHEDHMIRYQAERNLPSGGQPGQFYRHPERWGGTQCLIPIPAEDIDMMVQQYVPDNIFHFCLPEIHTMATSALFWLGNLVLEKTNAWAIFMQVLSIVMSTI
ncbi:hypothetical protein CPB86DRAFT_676292, partial [Serendipita vermifera]